MRVYACARARASAWARGVKKKILCQLYCQESLSLGTLSSSTAVSEHTHACAWVENITVSIVPRECRLQCACYRAPIRWTYICVQRCINLCVRVYTPMSACACVENITVSIVPREFRHQCACYRAPLWCCAVALSRTNSPQTTSAKNHKYECNEKRWSFKEWYY